MECSDFVSNSNYNVMIEKIQNNGKKLKYCSYSLIVLVVINIIFLILAFIEVLYKKDKCCCTSYNTKCCECCINCFEDCFEEKDNDIIEAKNSEKSIPLSILKG